MSELIAITFDDRERAQQARKRFFELSRSHLVELEDSVIAYKSDDRIRLDQTIDLTAAGAANGGMWGLLLGFLFTIPAGPAGAPLLPVVGTAVGAGLGAIMGKFADHGIDDELMRKLVADLEQGKATLFILTRKVTVDRVLEELSGIGGQVLTTSLPADLELALEERLRADAA